MGQITGGFATYARTVKTGEFENKKADVQLTFSCDEGDYEEIFVLACRQAKLKCEEMLGLRDGSTVSGGKSRGPAPEANDAAMKAKAEGKDAKAQKAAAAKAEKAKAKSEDEDEPDEPEADEPAEISDGDLAGRISKHVAAHSPKQTDVRKLIAKFSETEKAAGIPQAKREKFLAELAKLKKEPENTEDNDY